jgi:hypothetical protein
MPWGTHICLFYETPQDLLDTAVCYFEAGLKSNEFCVWAVSDPVSLHRRRKPCVAQFRVLTVIGRRGRSNCSQAPSGILGVTSSISNGSLPVGMGSSAPHWPEAMMA